MTDPGFDQQLHKLFAQAPALDDAARFAERVQGRLDRAWALRRVLIAVAGVAGGLVAAVQFMSAHVLARADIVSRSATTIARRVEDEALARLPSPLANLHGLLPGGEVAWMVAGLAVTAAALVAMRIFDHR